MKIRLNNFLPSGKPTVTVRYVPPIIKLLFIITTMVVVGFLCFIIGTLQEYSITKVSHQLPIKLNTNEHLNTTVVGVDQDTRSLWSPTSDQFQQETTCLAQNIYFESRNESTKGQIAVGLVTLNRVKSTRFPDTICDVVWQKRSNPKSGKMVAQFSWTWDGKPDHPNNKKKWDEIKVLAEAILAERSLDNFDDFTRGSTHYHADYVKPYWGKKFIEQGYYTTQIDTHIFYTQHAPDKKHVDNMKL